MELSNSNKKQSCNIKCKFSDVNTEIEISGCNVSFIKISSVSSSPSFDISYSIGLIFKFNKNTKYNFQNYLIDSASKSNFTETFRVDLSNLTVKFKHSDKRCEKPDLKTGNITSIVIQMNSTDEIYPCKRNYTEETTEYLTSVTARCGLCDSTPLPRKNYHVRPITTKQDVLAQDVLAQGCLSQLCFIDRAFSH
ncbi:hypothetical protein RF11_05644 [Thelohanellus kitauei]|uniref:Uncharacterized protein n=1 Tax=Thelohanellus kitauei TaxID=669202 RepID=A0A0C2IIH5_THEKT|nr:hypothetical protein RF11_05644 [Thelohanellus kitauei]